MTSNRVANPRRTTLAALQAGSACAVAGPDCRGTAVRLVNTDDGEQPACSTCANR